MTEPMEIEENENQPSLPERQPPVNRILFPDDRRIRRTLPFRGLEELEQQWAERLERATTEQQRGM